MLKHFEKKDKMLFLWKVQLHNLKTSHDLCQCKIICTVHTNTPPNLLPNISREFSFFTEYRLE